MSELHTSAAASAATMSREAEFATVFESNVQAVYNVALTATRDPVAAEDIAQTVFTNAFEHWDELRDRSRAKAWLLVSTANLARMHFRDTRPVEPMDTLADRAAPGPLLEDAVSAQEAANLVWEAAASLDPHHRIALDLRLHHDLSAAEVGDALGMPARKASDLLDRANEALRTAVRALLVRRQGRECPGLQLLLADATTEFTTAQRRTVDRHMRKCPVCRHLADRLTRPAELFGGLLLLPVPASLGRFRPPAPGSRPTSAPPTLSSRPRGSGAGSVRSALTTPVALAAAVTVVALGIGGGAIAAVHRGGSAPAQSVVAVVSAHPTIAAAATPLTTTPATAVPVTPGPSTLAPPDESTKSADAIWADTLTDIRSSTSYHIRYRTTAGDTDATAFDMVFAGGDHAGTITLAILPRVSLEVRAVAGTVYVHGPSVRAAPDSFGLSPAQATTLGNGWLALAASGPQSDVATLIERAVAPFANAGSLATGIVSPTGRTHSGGLTTLNGQAVIVLVDETGSLFVTDSATPYPVRIVGDYDAVDLSDFNAVAPVSLPGPVQRIPSG